MATVETVARVALMAGICVYAERPLSVKVVLVFLFFCQRKNNSSSASGSRGALMAGAAMFSTALAQAYDPGQCGF